MIVVPTLQVDLATTDIDGLVAQTAVGLPPSDLDPAPGWMRVVIDGVTTARTYDTRVDQ